MGRALRGLTPTAPLHLGTRERQLDSVSLPDVFILAVPSLVGPCSRAVSACGGYVVVGRPLHPGYLLLPVM
ncbi:uncharacterized protein STEHIDRAFT_143490 [Stereum hirsutum FP-91666 SS1]|uniref:uncharacterized protein n=1 Tax=Stereum hirsutum (strain FP-91666) TaxID=721885 RepID=UPI00044104A7|nr:uncharacterized protein STEHIDRAFT_143490 [Stereum hirsutum FP-91666 SS1]EIM92012.1 hypothetical protein STEHIDRAFT_143490 [Stereum hirsutum FP-91666 SS1]